MYQIASNAAILRVGSIQVAIPGGTSRLPKLKQGAQLLSVTSSVRVADRLTADAWRRRPGVHIGGNSLKIHSAGLQQWMLDMIPRQPAMLHTVEALIGGPVQQPLQNRGPLLVHLAPVDNAAICC